MTREELKEYCKKIMEEEHKQTILNFMIEIETLKLINKNLLSKTDQQDRIIKEAIDKLYCWGEVLDADFQKSMLEILDRNVI